ncbi:putative lipoyltransferase 2, mitochondrial [Coemansia sp. RSA 1933]|nr:putative lipoyltransferase 2, mitochondrial [Coemansia sp. RSA 1933]
MRPALSLRALGRGVFACKEISDCRLGRSATQLAKVPAIGYVDLGSGIGYRRGLEVQQRLVRKRIDAIQGGYSEDLADVVFLLQHAPVYTNGRRNHGSVAAAEIQRLQRHGAQYVETNRGGELTFHGPGQLVVYPVLHLRTHYLATRCFVQGLENTVIETCARLGVPAQKMPGFPGVWVSDTHKVAALGTHCQRYVTSHGVALNCATDLRWFDDIVPCGLPGKAATSLRRILLDRQTADPATVEACTTVDSVVPLMLDSFATVFSCDLVPLEQLSPATHSVVQDILASVD